MKNRLFSLSLFLIELFLFSIISRFTNLSKYLIQTYGSIWFILVMMYKHYFVATTLVWEELKNLLKVLVCYFAFSIIFMYPNLTDIFKVTVIGVYMFIVSIVISRTLRIIFRNIMAKRTLVVGTGPRAYRIATVAHNNRYALTKVVGFVKMGRNIHTPEIVELYNEREELDIYNYEEIEKVIIKEKIDQVIIAIPESSKELIDEVTRKLFNKVEYIKIAPNLDFTFTFNSKIDDFDGELLISMANGKINLVSRIIKRFIDICAGLVGCIILIPLKYIVKRMNEKDGDYDPIFFSQERIGKNGEPIKIYKFRSMVPNAEQVLEEMMENNPDIKEEYLKNKKLVNDPRITKAGHFLRKTSLDEFPQFINVLKGEMSLVGPRPYLPREKEDMDIYYDSIIRCKPGITGMWQANGRSDVGFEDRCKFDDYYYKNWSIGLDLIIIYKTVKSVFYGKGAL
jgi:undecaprenyl-phosphate galactose phosphotransferase